MKKIISFILVALLPYMVAVAEQVTYLHHDPLGSVIATSNSTGQVEKTTYLSYGLATTNKTGDPKPGYTGKSHFKGMGLTYFGSRWYDPEVGRFISIDPVAWQGSRPVHSFNRYAYANNNPNKYVDPDGEYPGLQFQSDYFSSGQYFKDFASGFLSAGADFIPGKGLYDAPELIRNGAFAAAAIGIIGEAPLLKGLKAAKGGGRFTYRGDSRSSSEIFENGFKPRGSSTDLHAHALDNTNPSSAFVSTSKSADVAADFSSNVYVVRPRNGIDVNKALGSRSPFPDELEIAVPGGVSPSDVRAVTRGNVSILNPGYKP